VFNANERLVKGQKPRGAIGKISNIMTDQGARNVDLVVTAKGYSFTTSEIDNPFSLRGHLRDLKIGLKREIGLDGVSGSVVESLRSMREGQCVRFDANVRRTHAGTERGRVCRAKFVTQFLKGEKVDDALCQ
jgi:hypothetical protein